MWQLTVKADDHDRNRCYPKQRQNICKIKFQGPRSLRQLSRCRVIVYGFSQFSTNTMHLHQVIDASGDNALQSPKLAQQLAAAFRTKARYGFECRGLARFGALAVDVRLSQIDALHRESAV